MTAKFIVIEGLEGAGKSTAIALCQQIMNQHQIAFINTREPGGTPLAESLRALVKASHEEEISPEAELLIMYAARAQLIHNVINPALANNTWVIGDRHDLSSRAYQGGGRQIEDTTLEALSKIVLKDLKPDLTLYLDIDPTVGLARAAERGELDRIEQEQLSFFQRSRAKYLEIAKQDPTIKVINAEQTIEQVHHDIQAVLEHFLQEL